MKTPLPSIKTKLKVVAQKKIRYVDMFSLTESVNSVLNGLCVHYFKQLQKQDITESYREEINKKRAEILLLIRNISDLDTAKKLERIILQYAPILKARCQTQ